MGFMTQPTDFTALTPSQIAKAEREERLAKRLRDNLRRRKAVARKHKTNPAPPSSDTD